MPGTARRVRPRPNTSNTVASTIDAAEVARFSAMAAEWWDPDGPARPLHRLNPLRLGFIRAHVSGRFGRSDEDLAPFRGLRVLDIGCGGGLLAEPMARLGADVVGLDASEKAVAAARAHAAAGGLEIDYRLGAVEDLATGDERFDIVLNMEIVEHVAAPETFLATAASLVAPGGCMVVATLNRTLKSLALAKVAAEYVLGWLPPGTHDWRRFMRPSELAAALRRGGLRVEAFRGLVYSPLAGQWSLSRDLAVNYMAFAVRD